MSDLSEAAPSRSGSHFGAIDDTCLMAISAAPGRACGPCTVCCTVLAEVELRKPMRHACDHVSAAGCRIYEQRPAGCRAFHCLWLRGALPADESYRPDQLGVLFDAYQPLHSGSLRVVALEAWTGALSSPQSAGLINAIASRRAIEVSRRDGAWQTRLPDGAPLEIAATSPPA